MTMPRTTDLLIKAYLAEGPVELPDRSFEVVRDEIERTGQRFAIPRLVLPAVSESERLVAAAAMVLILLVGINLIGPQAQRASTGPGPTSTPTATPTPTSTPAPTPPPQPSASQAFTGPGTFRLTDGFPVAATIELPAGWGECMNGPLEQSVCGPSETEISFMIIDNVVADPCVDAGLSPPVGPSVDDLVAGISGLNGFTASPPIDVTVDGHPAKEFTVTAPASTQCSLFTWMGPDRTNGVGPAEANRIRVVDVDGTRVLIAAAYHPDSLNPDFPDEALQALDSVRFP
jgi:hypothetical protein